MSATKHSALRAAAILVVAFFLESALAQQEPLHMMKPYEWAGLSEKEKDLYVMGILEG